MSLWICLTPLSCALQITYIYVCIYFIKIKTMFCKWTGIEGSRKHFYNLENQHKPTQSGTQDRISMQHVRVQEVLIKHCRDELRNRRREELAWTSRVDYQMSEIKIRWTRKGKRWVRLKTEVGAATQTRTTLRSVDCVALHTGNWSLRKCWGVMGEG